MIGLLKSLISVKTLIFLPALAVFSLVKQLRTFNSWRKMLQNDITLQIGERWAAALRRRFDSRHTAKLIANTFNVEIRTARAWLSGAAPFVKHLQRAGEIFGAIIIAEVLLPGSNWHGYARLENSLEELSLKICQIRDEVRQLGKGEANA